MRARTCDGCARKILVTSSSHDGLGEATARQLRQAVGAVPALGYQWPSIALAAGFDGPPVSLAEQRSAFERAHLAWEAGDFDGFLDLLDDNILYIVNVDGMQVPYAMSAVGKTDVQDRLQLLLDTFDVTTFAIE